ncbi:phage tail protein [Desulfarculus baarsii]
MSEPMAELMTALARLLPPSIAQDQTMAAVATVAGAEEERLRALTDRALIWARLDELPDAVLEHLGWGLHIDGWEHAATRELKIWLIRHFYDWHAHKGTAHGLALYWRVLLGRAMLGASPPGKSIWGVNISAQERAAREAPHPEIRVYPFRHGGVNRQSFFWGQTLGGPGEGCFLATGEAILRIGDMVELFDPLTGQAQALNVLAVSRDAAWRAASQRVEARLPATAAGLCWGEAMEGQWVDHGANGRLFTLDLERPYQDEIERRQTLSITPGPRPMRTNYEAVAEAGQAGAETCWGNRWTDAYQGVGGGNNFWGADIYFAPSEPHLRLYKRLKLFEPGRARALTRADAVYWGAFRVGSAPAHHADVAVDCQGQARPRAWFWGDAHWGQDLWDVSDAAVRIAQVRGVGRLAARLSDKVELVVTNRRIVRASAGLLAGSVVAGEYRLEVI